MAHLVATGLQTASGTAPIVRRDASGLWSNPSCKAAPFPHAPAAAQLPPKAAARRRLRETHQDHVARLAALRCKAKPRAGALAAKLPAPPPDILPARQDRGAGQRGHQPPQPFANAAVDFQVIARSPVSRFHPGPANRAPPRNQCRCRFRLPRP